MDNTNIKIWGQMVGTITWDRDREISSFTYHSDFLDSGLELAPLTMPLREEPYEFPSISKGTFKGLPGLLNDLLPDKFGNLIFNRWHLEKGKYAYPFHPVARLIHIGDRGIGALEVESSYDHNPKPQELNLTKLVKSINQVKLTKYDRYLDDDKDVETLENLYRIGISAGGARAKALVALNQDYGIFKSGPADISKGYRDCVLKFDGIVKNKDKGKKSDRKEYCKNEYAYYLMAREAGIEMMECGLSREEKRDHFYTWRFDRDEEGRKIHKQTLCAMKHFDFDDYSKNSYEKAIEAIKDLGLNMDVVEQQYRRAIFNILGRNHDDHVKNMAFLMDRSGNWSLSPAYDLTYSWDPDNPWTYQHLMSVNGKRDNFTHDDLLNLASSSNIKQGRAKDIIQDVALALEKWDEFAHRAQIDHEHSKEIQRNFRLKSCAPPHIGSMTLG